MDREDTTSSADTTRTTTKSMITATQTTMVLQWIDPEEATAHHLTVDTTSPLNTRCNTESRVRDHQEAGAPLKEGQQEVVTQEILEALCRSMRQVHLSGEREEVL